MPGGIVVGGVHGRGGMRGEGMHGGGTCMAGGGHVCVIGETATAAGSTHPTGMHSCFFFVLKSLVPKKNLRKNSFTGTGTMTIY